MERAGLEEGERTSDGARRFGDGLAQVPVWSATRAVCEKGSAKIIGGVVISDVDDSTAVTKRVGWWLSGDSDRYAIEVLTAVGERLKSMGVAVVVLHVRIADRLSLQVANEAGYRRTNALQHLSVTGEPIDFWAYAHP